MLRRGHALGLVLATATCAAPLTPPLPPPVRPAAPPAAPGPRAYADLSFAERARFMEKVVMPAMGAELRRFDATLFAEPSCATCHGENAEDRRYAMPNPKLARLSPDGRFVAEMRHSPDFTMFMVQRMQPRMRELLDDPGLDCFRCHLSREVP